MNRMSKYQKFIAWIPNGFSSLVMVSLLGENRYPRWILNQ